MFNIYKIYFLSNNIINIKIKIVKYNHFKIIKNIKNKF